ncbi:ribose-5-phosphate isomerase RpiA [Sporosarcina sp. E16_8]|uniref:ribose-5-phosphate isomerase RpiA n=1 Tax=Sporosarcina sp. E16_8 TaxID=2789295 RepID=UPI001A929FF7|nr:ribose-5-phosphate isomerase RpiA [Sporosarcina sp. E16_8]
MDEQKRDIQKKIAGEKAAEYIKDGMTIGLGSGSTVYWMLKKLGEMVEQGMNVKGIPSSIRTEAWAREFGIPLTDFSEVQLLDLSIDGANEIDLQFNLSKGGGGSLVREKIIDANSTKLIIIADESKLVSQLGKAPLPVEILQFGWEVTVMKIAQLGCNPVLRIREGVSFVSDNGNYIIDCKFDSIPNPVKLHQELKEMVGVVETGLFIGMTDIVILAGETEVKVIESK